MKYIVVDRSNAFGEPVYCIHGEALCVRCEHACWLGSETVKVVMEGEALPICTECVIELEAEGRLASRVPIGHVSDHLRADGPH